MRLLKDREELEVLRREMAALTWRNIELERYVVALRRALREALDKMGHSLIPFENDPRGLLDQTDIRICACGHMPSDHDKEGCMYLSCKNICGDR